MDEIAPFAALIVFGIGLVGLQQSRAFVPAFATAVLIRFFGNKDWGLIDTLNLNETVFTSDAMLLTLGTLALLEVFGDKVPEIRDSIMGLDKPVKTIMGVLTTVGVSGSNPELAETTIDAAEAGLLAYPVALSVGAGVWIATTLRNTILGVIREADPDDDIGIQGLLSWGEDIFSFFGLWILVLYPVFMAVLIGIAFGLLWLATKYLEWKDEKAQSPCPECQTENYHAALHCKNCNHRLAGPMQVGFLGGITKKPVLDLATQPYRLASKKRCPVCASRLKDNSPYQTCESCGHQLNADPAFREGYPNYVAKRLPIALIVGGLFSLIPIVGLIPGMIFGKVTVVAPYRRYLPWGKGCLTRLGVKIIFFILILVQVVPLAGGLVVPAMTLLSFGIHRGAYASALADQPKTD